MSSPHPEPVQGDHDEDRARIHQLLSRLTRTAAGHPDSSVRSPQDMQRAWAVVDVQQRASAALAALALVRVLARAEAAERDLAALQQERDDWRQAFETANEAIGKMEASHAQALEEAWRDRRC